MSDSFETLLQKSKQLFSSYFEFTLTQVFLPRTRITDACVYSLNAGGKRIRPIFAINSYFSSSSLPHTFSNEHLPVLNISFALECIHTYSLIHDDLPAMDNDDTRRGKPTNHIQFDETTAILAGDALNSLGFYLLSLLPKNDTNLVSDCIQILHKGAGFQGMILGQMEDIEAEKNPKPSDDPAENEKILSSIHTKKTGALIEASFLLGNRLRADYKERESTIESYAKEIGLLFQITDDILDVEGNKSNLGKTPGKDAKSGKLTYPSLYGLDKAKLLRDQTVSNAVSIANELALEDQLFFIGLPKYIAERKN
ncbi:polyprenyl synthetase family protein [Leptospira sp. 96542]|nr:polyprenyl synthetase family protein [Leptospira sp. 96542]